MKRTSYRLSTEEPHLDQHLMHTFSFFVCFFSHGLDLFLEKLYFTLVIIDFILEGGNILSLKAQRSL